MVTSTDPLGHTVRYGYDAANNVTSLTDASNKQTNYSCDAANRLSVVGMGTAGSVNYSWNPDGTLRQITYPSSMQRNYNYDEADRVTSIVNKQGATDSEEFGYTYDINSNRETEARKVNGQTSRLISYSYDAVDRLTGAAYAVPPAALTSGAQGGSAIATAADPTGHN